MRVYESLIPPYQRIVDRLVAYARETDWPTCRHYLTSTYEALYRNWDRFPEISPNRDFSHMVAAMIERLEEPEIEDATQAAIYAVSAEERHREAAAEWFEVFPDERDRLWEEYAGRAIH